MEPTNRKHGTNKINNISDSKLENVPERERIAFGHTILVKTRRKHSLRTRIHNQPDTAGHQQTERRNNSIQVIREKLITSFPLLHVKIKAGHRQPSDEYQSHHIIYQNRRVVKKIVRVHEPFLKEKL